MAFKDALLGAIERNENRTEAGVEKYFGVVNQVVDRTTSVLGKLPAGDKIAPRYSTFAGKAIDLQKSSVLKLVHAQPWTASASRAATESPVDASI
jgi:hypothetical protein